MSIKCEYKCGYQRFFESSTGQTVHVMAPIHFFDDFLGDSLISPWDSDETNLNVAGATLDAANGVWGYVMDADSNAELGALHHADKRSFDLNKLLVFEARVQVSVTPTGVGEAIWGMAGDVDADADTMTEGAWFKVDGSTAVVVETDDTTNNNDDVATGVVAGTTTWRIYRIEFFNLADVRFYIDGARAAAGTTFDMSNLTAAEAIMQPMFHIAKASGTGVGSLSADYVRVWCGRS